MKKLARMFYGRTASYADALEKGDADALAAALGRNIRPDEAEWPQVAALATYVIAADKALAEQNLEAISSGRIQFPAVQEKGAEQAG
jgi:cytochrome b pre-mRNA-processing protein 3